MPDYLYNSAKFQLVPVTPPVTIRVCVSSIGLDELKPKDARNPKTVLKIMADYGRFSVFDAVENKHIGKTVGWLQQNGYYRTIGGSYPWCNIEITDKGKAFLAET